jgi:hypothetical protein
MKIGLIDVDSHNFPNLALMKISAFHKSKGDTVEWYMPFNDRYDIVYKSKVFSFTPDYELCINADNIVQGGTGYAISLENGKEVYDKSLDKPLPIEIENIYPDYSIYPTNNTAYGFITRGCPRGCGFCIVGNKEGLKSVQTGNLRDFWRGEKYIELLDPNILACKNRIQILTELKNTGAKINFNQGLDIRLIDRDIAVLLGQIKMSGVHFAWDRYEDKDIIVPKFKLFAEVCPKLVKGHNGVVYMIVNFNTTINEDLERIQILRDMGYMPYVMIYNKSTADKVYRKMQRWCNNRFIFMKCPNFKEYLANEKRIPQIL